MEVLGNSVEVFGFRWRSQLSSSGLYVFLFLNIFLGRNHGSRATNTFASLSFYSAPLPILTNLLYLKSKNTKVRGSTFASCFQIIAASLPGTKSYCFACTPLNPNNCFALLLMLTLYNHSQTVRSSPFSSRRRALERLSRNGLLTGCTHHPAKVRLRSHLCLLAGEHTYGDEETDGNRTFSEVTQSFSSQASFSHFHFHLTFTFSSFASRARVIQAVPRIQSQRSAPRRRKRG